jgi:hypothetical protein
MTILLLNGQRLTLRNLQRVTKLDILKYSLRKPLSEDLLSKDQSLGTYNGRQRSQRFTIIV